MSLEEAKCFASMSHLGFQHPGIVLNQIIVPPYQRDTAIKRGRCSTLFFPVFHFNMTGPPLAMKVFFNHIHYVHDKCYAQDMGNISLGALNVSTQCKRGRTLVFGEGAPCNMSGYSNGTYPTDGGMWLCGNSAYYVLPPGWKGVCAPVRVTDHTFLITTEEPTADVPSRPMRNRRSLAHPTFAPHDAVWGANVPAQFRHSTVGDKIVQSLIPHFGVGKLALRLETVDYRFKCFLV